MSELDIQGFWLKTQLPTLVVGAVLALLFALTDPLGAREPLWMTASLFCRYLPLFLAIGFSIRLLFGLSAPKLEGVFLSSSIMAVVVGMSIFLVEPLLNEALRGSLEGKSLSDRILRKIALLESRLDETKVVPRDSGSEPILTTYRTYLQHRLRLLVQMLDLYSLLDSLTPNQNAVRDRLEALKLQREEVEKNLRRIPYLDQTRRLRWEDFSNLTADSALILAAELLQRRQWPEAYQVATLARLLGAQSQRSEAIRERAREELVKLPIVDGDFFGRKARAIELYKAGLFRQAFYLLTSLERENLVDEEVTFFLEASRRALLEHYALIQQAEISLEVPLFSGLFLVQNSADAPGSKEIISAEKVAYSQGRYLLGQPVILRLRPDGSWSRWEAEYARVIPDPRREGAWVLDFRFLHDTVDQLQRFGSSGELQQLSLTVSPSWFLGEISSWVIASGRSFDRLWRDAWTHPEYASRVRSSVDFLLRLYGLPWFLTVLFLLVYLIHSYSSRTFRQLLDRALALLLLVPGMFWFYEGFRWTAQVTLGGVVSAIGFWPSLVLTALFTLAALVTSAYLAAQVSQPSTRSI